MYEDYLELFDFKREEIREELPRIEKAFEKLRVGPEDIERGKKKLEEYFDLELRGMRKLLKVFFKEMISLTLSKEEKEKLIYTTLPGFATDFIAVAMVGHDDIYAGFTDLTYVLTLNPFLGIQDRLLEAAERSFLPPGGAHCGCNQTSLGAYELGILGKPDLIVAWGEFCDEDPKANGLIAELYDVPIVYVDRYQDEGWDEAAPTARNYEFLAAEMRRSMKEIERVVGHEIPIDVIMEQSMDTFLCLEDAVAMQDLIATCDPVPLSLVDLVYAYFSFTLIVRPENRPLRKEALSLLRKEVEERAHRGEGVAEKGAPRILMTIPPMAEPALIRMVERCGLQCAVEEISLWPPDARFFPDIGGDAMALLQEDPYRMVAKFVLSNPFVSHVGVRKSLLPKALKRYNLDGILVVLAYSCRIGSSDGGMVKDAIVKETGLPCLVLEADIWDPRYYTPAQLQTRIESFAETVKASVAARRNQ